MQKTGSAMFVIAGLFAYAMAASVAAVGPLSVYTVNYPLYYFANRIGGEHVDAHFPVPADVDPAFWMPDANAIADYQQADLILLHGAGYAKWIDKVTLPRFRMVNTSAGTRERYITESGIVTHSHGPTGDHSHTDTAFTTWLDFSLALEQARAIRDALVNKRPDRVNEFEKNYQALKKDLLGLDTELRQLVSKSAESQQPLLTSHPVYQYLARRYGLNLKSVLWESDAMPSAAQWNQLGILLKASPAKWMVWKGPPLEATRSRLRLLGIRSVVFDPSGGRPKQGDWLSIMQQNVKNLAKVFQ